MLTFKKSSTLPPTVTSQQHGIMMLQCKMMKNTYVKVVTKFQGSTMLQRKDILNLIKDVAKQWKLRSNGHLTDQVQGHLVHGKFTTKRALYACLAPKVGGGHVQSVLPRPTYSAASDFCHKYTVQLPQFLVDSRSDHCVHAPFKNSWICPSNQIQCRRARNCFRTQPRQAWSLLFADSADTLNSLLACQFSAIKY